MWVKSKKGAAKASQPANSTESSGIVVSHITSRRTAKAKAALKSKELRCCYLALLVILLVVAGLVVWQHRRDNHPETTSGDQTYKLTDEEYAKVRAASLQKAKPAANASIEDKAAYYDELAVNEFTAGNFKQVTSVYEEAVTVVQENNLELSTYLVAAKSYAKLNDKTKAESILSIAEQKVKSSNNSDEFKRTELLSVINGVREEIKK